MHAEEGIGSLTPGEGAGVGVAVAIAVARSSVIRPHLPATG
jgi:hypothetical protein